MPAVVWGPGFLVGDHSVSGLATVMDVFPTIAALVGLDAAPGRPFDGKDLLPWLEGGPDSPNELFFYVYPDVVRGVRDSRWKLLVRRASPEAELTEELYDLASDPYERFDLAAEHPDVVERLLAEMTRFAAESGARLPSAD